MTGSDTKPGLRKVFERNLIPVPGCLFHKVPAMPTATGTPKTHSGSSPDGVLVRRSGVGAAPLTLMLPRLEDVRTLRCLVQDFGQGTCYALADGRRQQLPNKGTSLLKPHLWIWHGSDKIRLFSGNISGDISEGLG